MKVLENWEVAHLSRIEGGSDDKRFVRRSATGNRGFHRSRAAAGHERRENHTGITLALKQMADRGWHADLCLLRPDETAGPDVERSLKAQTYDCVVIGAGIRRPPRNLSILETVINAVHRAAPGATIAFNTHPEDSADAAARWLKAAD